LYVTSGFIAAAPSSDASVLKQQMPDMPPFALTASVPPEAQVMSVDAPPHHSRHHYARHATSTSKTSHRTVRDDA